MEWLDQIISAGVMLLILLVYLYLNKKPTQGHNQRIPNPTMQPLGQFHFETKWRISQFDELDTYYKALKKDSLYIGLYFFKAPTVLVMDLDIANAIIHDTFDHFDHEYNCDEKYDPISITLFNVNKKTRRKLRSRVSAAFTRCQMKEMFSDVLQVTDINLIPALDLLVDDQSNGINIKDLMRRFTTDVIADAAFGQRGKSNDFKRIRAMAFNGSSIQTIKYNFTMLFPDLASRLSMKIIRPEVSQFFASIERNIEINKVVGNDHLTMLISLNNDLKPKQERLTLWQVMAYSIVFFTAGFDASTTTLTFCLYELSIHQDIQEKARKHVKDVLKNHKGQFSYEALEDLTYLDTVLHETLRKYPVSPVIQQMVTKDYQLDSDIVWKRGTLVLVPVNSIHHDPDIYTDPERFHPERFNEGQDMDHLGFWNGKRNCVESRLGMMLMKIGLVRMLTRYRFERSSDKVEPLKLDIGMQSVCVLGEVSLNVIRID